ncbi:transporter family-2 protein [Prauserella shujinwangii]|uniref:Transporter family-2 protein n=1 Tax=Prauserella shujinwangii TaxID=1453103 RepID=A0A2T0M2H9_9PSEU|nr:DMT family transporter [Prauserella shujinwangii]PRX50963.1 transporter family-2 protein [Prauserella shujinwangii]
MHSVFLLAALLVGGLLAVQASANVRLTGAVGTPYAAATLQLGLAAALLGGLAVAAGATGSLPALADVPAWQLLGGLASPLYITSAILLFPRLGAVSSVGLFVTGQLAASLALDLFGPIGVPRRGLTVGAGLGALAVLAGITVVLRGQRAGTHGAVAGGGRPRAAWIVLGVAAGAALPVQGAVNAALLRTLREPFAVALTSFTVATAAILVLSLALLVAGRTPRPAVRPLADMPWWGWAGAGCAAAYVTATFLLIPVIGAATTVALTVTGQQLASAAIDGRGLFLLPRRPLTTARVAGLSLLVVGSGLVQMSSVDIGGPPEEEPGSAMG